jgi:hypothetical protein
MTSMSHAFFIAAGYRHHNAKFLRVSPRRSGTPRTPTRPTPQGRSTPSRLSNRMSMRTGRFIAGMRRPKTRSPGPIPAIELRAAHNRTTGQRETRGGRTQSDVSDPAAPPRRSWRAGRAAARPPDVPARRFPALLSGRRVSPTTCGTLALGGHRRGGGACRMARQSAVGTEITVRDARAARQGLRAPSRYTCQPACCQRVTSRQLRPSTTTRART